MARRRPAGPASAAPVGGGAAVLGLCECVLHVCEHVPRSEGVECASEEAGPSGGNRASGQVLPPIPNIRQPLYFLGFAASTASQRPCEYPGGGGGPQSKVCGKSLSPSLEGGTPAATVTGRVMSHRPPRVCSCPNSRSYTAVSVWSAPVLQRAQTSELQRPSRACLRVPLSARRRQATRSLVGRRARLQLRMCRMRGHGAREELV